MALSKGLCQAKYHDLQYLGSQNQPAHGRYLAMKLDASTKLRNLQITSKEIMNAGKNLIAQTGSTISQLLITRIIFFGKTE